MLRQTLKSEHALSGLTHGQDRSMIVSRPAQRTISSGAYIEWLQTLGSQFVLELFVPLFEFFGLAYISLGIDRKLSRVSRR